MATLLDKANAVKSQKDMYIVPENLRAGVTALGVTGTYSGLDTSDADATASDIIQGKTAYVNGEKITGIYDGGTIESNIELNVFLQEQEPERKDGVWIRDGETVVSGTKFMYDTSLQDEFVDNKSVRYLRDGVDCIGQIIIDGYLYSIGKTSSNSRKYNLTTRKATTLNTPDLSSYTIGNTTGAIKYGDYIYVFFQHNDNKISLIKYNFTNNTSTVSQVGSFYSYDEWVSNVHLYADKMYFISGYSDTHWLHTYDCIHNQLTRSNSQEDKNVWRVDYLNNATSDRNDEYFYFISGNPAKLYMYNVLTRGYSVFVDLSTYISSSDNCSVYCTNDYIYVFKFDSDKFYKIRFLDKSITTHNIGFKLQIKSTKGSRNRSILKSCNSIVLDDLSGRLYFRTSNAYYKGNVSCMQLYSEEHLGSNKVVVQLSNSYPFLKLENTTGLYSGVKETYLIKNNVISSDHMMCFGNGTYWEIIKNPHNETCTVTFDLDGGTGEIESQTFVCGGRVTEPIEIPTKTDYAFDGWLLNNEIFDFSRNVLSNTTLKARWASAIAVTFDDNQGNVNIQYVIEGHTATIPERPAKPDDQHKFYRWTLNGEPFDFNTPIIEPITLVAEYIEASDVGPLTQSNFENDGNFYNVTPSYLSNQAEGSDGFRIVGTCSGDSSSSWETRFPLILRFTYKIDLTTLDQIDFYAKKVNDHGIASIQITPEYNSSIGTVVSKQVHYSSLPTTYTHYAVDVSNITGEYYVHFVGGYTDSTGNSSSATDYCNIRFLAESDFTDRIVL